MKKKIYISLPIAHQEDTVFDRNEAAKNHIAANMVGYDCHSPIDVNHINGEALANHTDLDRTAYYMGKDIEAVILCDAILMCPGWENSKGCKVEKYTAETYGKEIYYL